MCAKPYHTKNIGNKCIRSLLFIISALSENYIHVPFNATLSLSPESL